MNKRILLAIYFILAYVATISSQTPNFTTMKNMIGENSLPLVNLTVKIDKVSKPEYTQAKIEIVDPLKRTNGNIEATFNLSLIHI